VRASISWQAPHHVADSESRIGVSVFAASVKASGPHDRHSIRVDAVAAAAAVESSIPLLGWAAA
jgi:hypothetical protein